MMFQVGQPKEVDDLVYGGKLKGGFFLEARFSFSLVIAFGSVSKMFFLQAGSHDFETNSDSLYWELEHGWTGLLVEPHPLSFSFGVSK